MRNTLGIILGGGQGKRLYPLTKFRSKPAVPLGGKYRLIDIPISNCLNSGVNKIFILTQFNSASLNRHINFAFKFDFFRDGFVDILAAEQTVDNTDWFQGTADAVRKSMRHFRAYRVPYYLILAGDHIYRMDYSLMRKHHEEYGADVTVGVVPVTREQVTGLGILQIDNDCRISKFIEKPLDDALVESLKCPPQMLQRCGLANPSKQFLASMGIYLFKYQVLEEALTDIDKTDFGKEIIPALIDRAKVYAYPFLGYWEDIGTIPAFYRANLSMTQENPSFDFFSLENPIYTNPRFLPGSKIFGGQLVDSIISEGCFIKDAAIERSIVGLRSIINQGAIIQDTQLMGADYYQTEDDLQEDLKLGRPHIGIGPYSRIAKAIIDKNARLGKNVRIGPHPHGLNASGANYIITDGITVVEKDAVLQDGTVI